MGVYVIPAAGDFPQDNGNRTRAQLVEEVLGFTGGIDDTDMKGRAAAALNSAVREFNFLLWKFNRMRQDITLTAGRDFTLEAPFRATLNAQLLDANGDARDRLEWVPFEEFAPAYWDLTDVSSYPEVYTIRNAHETGILSVNPKLVTPLQYPTLRLDYFRRIVKLAGDEDVLNVPEEVEEAIVKRAIAILLSKVRSVSAYDTSARDATAMARDLFNVCRAQYEDFPDF